MSHPYARLQPWSRQENPMSTRFDEGDHPRGNDGKFAPKALDEADIALLSREPFDLYADTVAEPYGQYANSPYFEVAAVQPGFGQHVALGPGRAWAQRCGETNPRTGMPCDALLFADDPGGLASAQARHVHTEHRTRNERRPDGSQYMAIDEVPLGDDEWIVDERHGIRACFTNIGEGWNGDYDPSDPNDDNLLRIDVEVRPEHPEAADDETADDETGPWRLPVGTGSWCTQVRADHVTPEQKRRMLRQAVEDLAAVTAQGTPISHVIDSFQGMSEADDDSRYEGDSPTEHEKRTLLAEMIAEGRYATGTPTRIEYCPSCDDFEGFAESSPERQRWSGEKTQCLACSDRAVS